MGRIGPAAVKCSAGKAGHRTRRGSDHDAGVLPGVTDEIIRSLFALVIMDAVLCSRTGMRQQINGPVGLVDVIERSPAAQIRFVLRLGIAELDVTRILVPAEFHSYFGALYYPLLVEEIGLFSQCSSADFGHQVGVDEAPEARTLAIELGYEIALPLVRDPDRVFALVIHFLVFSAEEIAAFLSQHLQHLIRHSPFQNEIPLFIKLPALLLADLHQLFGPYSVFQSQIINAVSLADRSDPIPPRAPSPNDKTNHFFFFPVARYWFDCCAACIVRVCSMKFIELTEEHRQFFDENGYLIVREALDEEMLQRVVGAADRLVSQRYLESGGRRASLSNVIAQEDEFIPLLTWGTTVPLVVQLLSYNIRLTKAHLIYKYPDPPETPDPTYWHRDVANSSDDLGPARNARLEIKIAYHLSDVMVPDSGNTWLAPGSNNYTRPLEIPAGETDPANAFEPQLRAGDAFLFENRTFHRGGANRTQQTRKVLMFGYSYAWLSPNDFVVQTEDVLERFREPIGRQLIGALRQSNSQIDSRPLREWVEQHGVRRASEIEYERTFALNSALTS